MMLIMVGSTVSKHSRSDVGMGSSSHDLGTHLVMSESKYSVVIVEKEVNGVCWNSISWL